MNEMEDDEELAGELRLEVPVETAPGAPARLDAWLAARTGWSREKVRRLLEAGLVRRADGSIAPPGKRHPEPGAVYVVREPEPESVELIPQDIPISIVYEDANMLVVDKQAGLVVHPACGHPDGTLVNAVLFHCPGVLSVGGERRPGIVHRLDRDTSGLIVVAKTDAALAALQEAFKSGEVRKTYLAISCGVPEPPRGRIEANIGRSPADRKKMAILERGGKPAVTEWEVEEDFVESALLRVRIHTGRTHQIRVHLSSIGCPVAGDRAYGSAAADAVLPFRPDRQMLHAWRLELPHPVSGARLSFEAPPPEDFACLLAALRRAGPKTQSPEAISDR